MENTCLQYENSLTRQAEESMDIWTKELADMSEELMNDPMAVVRSLNDARNLCTAGFLMRRQIQASFSELLRDASEETGESYEDLTVNNNVPWPEKFLKNLSSRLEKYMLKEQNEVVKAIEWFQWLSDKKYPRKRELAVKLSFLLNMDDYTTTKFLLACGHEPFSVRNPLDCICLCGAKPGWTLVVTAGVHGCEYVGIQALRTLAQELDPSAMAGNVVLLPLANPYGFYAGAKRVIPEDGVNLNRAFPGDRNGSLGQRLAFALENGLYPVADFLADLHGGECNMRLHPLVFFPTAGKAPVNAAALEAAKRLSVDYRVRSTARDGLYSWAVQQGIPALLIERGGQGLWSQPEVNACKADVLALM